MINPAQTLNRFTVVSIENTTAQRYTDHVLADNSEDAFTLVALARPGVDLVACFEGHQEEVTPFSLCDPSAEIWTETHGANMIAALLKNHGVEIHAAEADGYYWQHGDLTTGDIWDTPEEARLQALIHLDLEHPARESDSVIVPPDMPDAQPLPDAPRDTAARFYQAILDGTETLGAVAEKHGPMAIVNLVYLLGGMMREDAGLTGSPSGICVELWDHHDDLGLLDLLNEIKAECPELAPAIQLGLDKIHVMPLED